MAGHADPLSVLVVGDQLGLPAGRAATAYLTLVARGLREAGADVAFLLAKCSEADPGSALNTAPRGEVHGISYEYATGTPIRSPAALRRTLANLRSLATVARRLRSRSARPRTVVLRYAESPEVIRWVRWWARRSSLPVVPHVVEWRAAFPARSRREARTLRLMSRLCFAAAPGAVVISSFLEERCREAAAQEGREIPCLRLPILVDPAQPAGPAPPAGGRPYGVYCGSLRAYLPDVEGIVRSVAAASGELDLIVVGEDDPPTRERLLRLAGECGLGGRLRLHRYLPPGELHALYAGAAVLLAPMQGDERSLARFPSKIGEYLMSGRPVVTAAYGEVGAHLEHGHTAFVAPTGSAPDFARAIREALGDPARAAAVGAAGRELALRRFDYRANGSRLREFLSALAGRRSPPSVGDPPG